MASSGVFLLHIRHRRDTQSGNIVGKLPGNDISGSVITGNYQEITLVTEITGNLGGLTESRAGAASPNLDIHFQWDWRATSSLGTVGHAPGAWAWPHPAHSPKRVCRVHA